ncbi:MAG TPA: hypothetical protein VJI67_04375 [archaeon]|nr:hypothetical protein [archaeon]
MDKSLLLRVVGDTSENRVIDFLIEGSGIDYTKKDMARGAGISRPTLYKLMPKLLKEGVAKPTRAIGNVQLYTLNTESEKVKALLKLEEFLLKRSFDKIEGKKQVKA